MIFIVTLICVGILLVNQFVINTVYGELVSMGQEREELRTQVEEAKNLINRQEALEARWDELLANGMRDETSAESMVFTSLRETQFGHAFVGRRATPACPWTASGPSARRPTKAWPNCVSPWPARDR